MHGISHTARAAIIAGSVAGILDIGAAALINTVSPLVILQSIASGLLGMRSYADGASSMVLGLVLQIAMSVLIAEIYAVASNRLRWLTSHPLPAGLAFGAGVFVVMNMIVVPLSAFGPRPSHISTVWLLLNVAAMLGFGVLVAFLVRRSLIHAASHAS